MGVVLGLEGVGPGVACIGVSVEAESGCLEEGVVVV